MVLDRITFGYQWCHVNTEQSLGVKSPCKEVGKKIQMINSLKDLQKLMIMSVTLRIPVLL